MSPREIKDVSYDFSGRVVMITGAGRGQGRAHALGFAAAGADLVLCDIAAPIETIPYEMASEEELNAVADEARSLGARCQVAICDVGKADQVEPMVDAAITEFGKIDVLINNAGTNSVLRLDEITEQAWDAVVDSQLRGAFNCSKFVSAPMVERGSGKILVTGSTGSFIAVPKNIHYVAAKHGMLGLVRAMALELAPQGITVNMVCPGALQTGMAEGMGAANPEWARDLGDLTGAWNIFDPTRMLDVEEVTNALLWLSSDAASFITGVALPIDAGYGLK